MAEVAAAVAGRRRWDQQMQWLEKLKGFREVGAYVMMGAIGLSILAGLIRIAAAGEYDPGLATRASWYYGAFLAPIATVVLVLLVLSLATQEPKSPRAGMIALIGAIVTAVSVAAAFVFGLIGLGNDFAGAGDLLPYLIGWLVALIVPVLGAIVLFLIHVGAKPAPAYQHPQQYGSAAQGQMGPGYQGQPGAPAPGQPQAQPGQQPTWAPDQASGGAWQTAGHAASGASATEWGQPGQQQGWAPGSAMSATEHTGPIPTDPAQQPQQGQSAQQGWGPGSAMSATEHTGPIPTDPAQQPGQPGPGQYGAPQQPGNQWSGQQENQWSGQPENQWQPVDPNEQQGGYR
ncbi:MAG: hypothetical protein GXX86_10995 [Propionibacterium sp.]|nr:hypothetical protein [Propionibacterium sp.]